eukprot:GHVT01048703.1.p1 GENE.GHVT01048703.1~~GHVT01048703.1.p1  ORF type:complete len:354 (-),score=66.21 GHVT01048703.1:3771-4832(-)
MILLPRPNYHPTDATLIAGKTPGAAALDTLRPPKASAARKPLPRNDQGPRRPSNNTRVSASPTLSLCVTGFDVNCRGSTSAVGVGPLGGCVAAHTSRGNSSALKGSGRPIYQWGSPSLAAHSGRNEARPGLEAKAGQGREPAQGFPPGDSRHPTSFLSSVANASTAGLPDNDSSTGADTLPFSRRPLLLPSRRRLSSPGVCVEVAATAAAREKPAQKTAAVGDDKAVEDEAADTWRNPKNANAPNAQKAEQNDDPNFWTNLTVENPQSLAEILNNAAPQQVSKPFSVQCNLTSPSGFSSGGAKMEKVACYGCYRILPASEAIAHSGSSNPLKVFCSAKCQRETAVNPDGRELE